MSSSPPTKSIFTLLGVCTLVPTTKSLFAEFHLIAVSSLAFLLNLRVVFITFPATGPALANAGKGQCSEKQSGSTTPTPIDCNLGGLRKSLPFLGN